LRKHARELITKENPNFTGSASWAQNFLLRHKLALHPDGKEPLSSTSSQRLYIITMREEDFFEIYFGSKSYSEVGTLHKKSRDDCSFLTCI